MPDTAKREREWEGCPTFLPLPRRALSPAFTAQGHDSFQPVHRQLRRSSETRVSEKGPPHPRLGWGPRRQKAGRPGFLFFTPGRPTPPHPLVANSPVAQVSRHFSCRGRIHSYLSTSLSVSTSRHLRLSLAVLSAASVSPKDPRENRNGLQLSSALRQFISRVSRRSKPDEAVRDIWLSLTKRLQAKPPTLPRLPPSQASPSGRSTGVGMSRCS
jgi:hypothetical protein